MKKPRSVGRTDRGVREECAEPSLFDHITDFKNSQGNSKETFGARAGDFLPQKAPSLLSNIFPFVLLKAEDKIGPKETQAHNSIDLPFQTSE